LGRLALATFLAGLVLFLTICSSSSSFHHWVHPGGSDSTCVVCLIAKSHVAAVDAPVIRMGFIFCFVGLLLPLAIQRISRNDLRLVPGRAPPCR
jgi:hypothetical protein